MQELTILHFTNSWQLKNIGDIQATGTVNMTTAGDQVASITITNGGYGYKQSVDNSYNTHPTIVFVNAGGDTTGFWCCCTSSYWVVKILWVTVVLLIELRELSIQHQLRSK